MIYAPSPRGYIMMEHPQPLRKSKESDLDFFYLLNITKELPQRDIGAHSALKDFNLTVGGPDRRQNKR